MNSTSFFRYLEHVAPDHAHNWEEYGSIWDEEWHCTICKLKDREAYWLVIQADKNEPAHG